MAKKATTPKPTPSKQSESVGSWLHKHFTAIKGIGLIVVGLLLIGITSPVIVRLLILLAGASLVYSGLIILKARHITKFIDEAIRKMRER